MTTATFFLSAGRCGTQWLAAHLGANYPDLASVEHEPLHDAYRSRDLLGTLDPAGVEVIARHVAEIGRRLDSTDYIECGWPSWAAIPFLARRFPGRVRIVHLTRHPVPTACSWVTHGAYRPPILPGLHPEKVFLSPFDAGVRLAGYRERWPLLDPFEKCLFFWAEVHGLGLALESELGVPWLRIRYEDLFSEECMERLLTFLVLPRREPLFQAKASFVDRFRYLTEIWWDPGMLDRHPGVGAVAERLGYRMDDFDPERLRERYLAWR